MSLTSRIANLFRAGRVSRIGEGIEWRLWEAAAQGRDAPKAGAPSGGLPPESLLYRVRAASPVMINIPLVTILATTLAAVLPAAYPR
jgi:hypothetical protein